MTHPKHVLMSKKKDMGDKLGRHVIRYIGTLWCTRYEIMTGKTAFHHILRHYYEVYVRGTTPSGQPFRPLSEIMSYVAFHMRFWSFRSPQSLSSSLLWASWTVVKVISRKSQVRTSHGPHTVIAEMLRIWKASKITTSFHERQVSGSKTKR